MADIIYSVDAAFNVFGDTTSIWNNFCVYCETQVLYEAGHNKDVEYRDILNRELTKYSATLVGDIFTRVIQFPNRSKYMEFVLTHG